MSNALPPVWLQPDQVAEIRAAVALREHMRELITEHLTNEAIAKKMGLCKRTIDRCAAGHTYAEDARDTGAAV